MELTFDILAPGAEIKTLTIKRDQIRIGNDFKSQIQLTGDVARMHAMIDGTNHDNITILDMGHVNGSKVNGVKVGKQIIKLGDVIQIGDCKVTLVKSKFNEDEKVYVAPPVRTVEEQMQVNIPAANFPEWFRAEPGFKFLDKDGDLIIILGPGEFAEIDFAGAINLKGDKSRAIYEVTGVSANLTAAAFVGGRWHLWDVSLEDESYWASSKPFGS